MSYQNESGQSARRKQSAVPAPARRRVAAFFDLDKTIIAKSSAYAFNKKFHESGLLSTSGVVQMALSQALYISQGHDHDQMEAARDQLSAMVTGWKAETVRKIAEESLHQVISPYVYAEARELIQHHQRLGHDVYVVSASAEELVEPIAAAIGVPRTVATRLEVKDGIYTGVVPFFCRGGNKSAELQRLAKLHGYDLNYCYAYSDSITDEPMLSTVGYPMATNPDKALRKLAAERNWPIRDFHNPEPLFKTSSQRVTAVSVVTALVTAIVVGFALRRSRPSNTDS
ncbi:MULTISPECIES: HAD family hydrolase [unclassified Corynebacterium]|uniref:HAD family hydrolase n=1 Tax=unclassified Corynebacterium TaxID=2624378 RepID=UPI0030AA46C5